MTGAELLDPAGAAPFRAEQGGLDDERVLALLREHTTRARAETAPGSAHAVDAEALEQPDVSFWTLWDGSEPIAIGALRRLAPDHGELKSMFTAEAHRGRGAGHAMLRHLLERARAEGCGRVSLETGSWPYFAPARALYRHYGFVECEPFGEYRDDPNSVFMTLDLAREP